MPLNLDFIQTFRLRGRSVLGGLFVFGALALSAGPSHAIELGFTDKPEINFDLQDFLFAQEPKFSGQKDFYDPLIRTEAFLVGSGLSVEDFELIKTRFLKYRVPQSQLTALHNDIVKDRVKELSVQAKTLHPQLKVAIQRLEKLLLEMDATQESETQHKPMSYWQAYNQALQEYRSIGFDPKNPNEQDRKNLNRNTFRLLETQLQSVKKPRPEIRLQVQEWQKETASIRSDLVESFVLRNAREVRWGLWNQDSRKVPEKVLPVAAALEYLDSHDPEELKKLYYKSDDHWIRYTSIVELFVLRGLSIRGKLGDPADFLKSVELMDSAMSLTMVDLIASLKSNITKLSQSQMTEVELRNFVADVKWIKHQVQSGDREFAFGTWLNFFDNEFEELRLDEQHSHNSITTLLAWTLEDHPIHLSRGPHYMKYLVEKAKEIAQQFPEILKKDRLQTAGSTPHALMDIRTGDHFSAVTIGKTPAAQLTVKNQNEGGKSALKFNFLHEEETVPFEAYTLLPVGTPVDLITESAWYSMPGNRKLPIPAPEGFELVDFTFKVPDGDEIYDHIAPGARPPFYQVQKSVSGNFYQAELNFKKGTPIQLSSRFRKIKSYLGAPAHTVLSEKHSVEALVPMMNDLFMIEEFTLSQALEEKLSQQELMSIKEIANLIKTNTCYSYGSWGSVSIYDRKQILDFQNLVVDGQLAVQCVAASELTLRLLNKVLEGQSFHIAQVNQVDRKDSKSPISGHGHRLLAVFKNNIFVGYVDPTPAYKPQTEMPLLDEVLKTQLRRETLSIRLKALQEAKAFHRVVQAGDKTHPAWKMNILGSLLLNQTPTDELAETFAKRIGYRAAIADDFLQTEMLSAVSTLAKMNQQDPIERSMVEATRSLLIDMAELIAHPVQPVDCEQALKAAE